MGAQDFVSFGYRSQSRETMEYSAKSECDGAFERRRETSPLPPREPNSPVVKQDKYEQDMDQMKTAQGDLAVNMDQMETTQGDLAFMDTVDLIKQGQSAVATGSNNNNGKVLSQPAVIIIMERIRMDWRRKKRRARRRPRDSTLNT